MKQAFEIVHLITYLKLKSGYNIRKLEILKLETCSI